MSHRFPPIAPQAEFAAAPSRARVLTLPQAPSLPWFELALGLALFILLRGF
jgi:hypothetical protein